MFHKCSCSSQNLCPSPLPYIFYSNTAPNIVAIIGGVVGGVVGVVILILIIAAIILYCFLCSSSCKCRLLWAHFSVCNVNLSATFIGHPMEYASNEESNFIGTSKIVLNRQERNISSITGSYSRGLKEQQHHHQTPDPINIPLPSLTNTD